jgi:hypothetical protein
MPPAMRGPTEPPITRKPQRSRSKSSGFRSRSGDPRNRNSPLLVDTISPGRRASSRTCLEAASAISSCVGDGATMLLRSRRIRSICLLRSRLNSSRLGSICLLRSRVSSCRRRSNLSREALTRACHSSRLVMVVSAVARSCAQQPIERPAVRLKVTIKKRFRFMQSNILAM